MIESYIVSVLTALERSWTAVSTDQRSGSAKIPQTTALVGHGTPTGNAAYDLPHQLPRPGEFFFIFSPKMKQFSILTRFRKNFQN